MTNAALFGICGNLPQQGGWRMSACNTESRVNNRGATLLELLVAIGVIAILLGVTLPAVAHVRRLADIADCQSSLRSIMQGAHASIGANAGAWPNLFSPGQDYTVYEPPGTTGYSLAYFDQVRRWVHVVEGHLWETNDERDMQAVSCRAAIRKSERRYGETSWSVVGAGQISFYLSAAFFSAPDLWDPDDPVIRDEPERRRAVVYMSQVAYPSSKVALAEVADHHESGRDVADSRVRHVNAAFVDGHVRRVFVPDAAPPLRYTPMTVFSDRNAVLTPFSSAAWGYAGRDY